MIEPKRGSDNAAFDPHQTDPAQLKAEIQKDLGATKTYECPECDHEVKTDKKPGRCPKCKIGVMKEI